MIGPDGSSQVKILLIEDDIENAELIEACLTASERGNKYIIDHMLDIESAKHVIYRDDIDLILLDLNLEKTKGLDSFKNLQSVKGNIPIIVITGINDLKLEKELIKLGAQDYIPKSKITSFNLSASIFHAIERHNNFTKSIDELQLSEGVIVPKVLVVDDLKENLISIKSVLKPLNAEVYTAQSGNEALSLMLDNEFAVVLLDVQMPVMDGFETASLMRSYEKTMNTPIVFITAISKEELYISKGYGAGAVDYLFKPLNVEVLLSKVNVFIGLYVSNKRNNMDLLRSLNKAKSELEKKNTELEYLAKNDSLTQISNRFYFEKHLQGEISASRRHKRIFGLLFVDVDNFKWINDNLGHDEGDKVLKNIATLLTDSIRKNDFAARIGGDEFAVIISTITCPEDAGNVAEKIMSAFVEKRELFGENVEVSISIGISVFDDPAETMKSIIKKADVAMYRAKTAGKNCFRYYSEKADAVYNRINLMKSELKKAISSNQMFLHYQPVVDISSGKVVGVEALLRWKSDKLTGLRPDEFIPVAEKTGDIHKIGFWVIEESFRTIKKVEALGVTDLFFSINLSPVQLENTDFNDDLCTIIKNFRPYKSRIDFELTESSLSTFLKKSELDCFEFLKNNGFNLSIDDFGTGYSSLDRLASLPINTLKIDGSFVKNIVRSQKANDIIKCILALSNALELNTIAECVETKEQADFLVKNSCGLAQGFYYYKPLPEDKFLELIKSNK